MRAIIVNGEVLRIPFVVRRILKLLNKSRFVGVWGGGVPTPIFLTRDSEGEITLLRIDKKTRAPQCFFSGKEVSRILSFFSVWFSPSDYELSSMKREYFVVPLKDEKAVERLYYSICELS